LTAHDTATGVRMLTSDYASLEQVDGCPVTTATDIYSMGTVLYRLLTGTSFHYSGSDSAGVMAMAIVNGRITLLSKLTPGLRGDLEAILMKALRKDPQERYATIEEFADDLKNFLDYRPILACKGDRWYRLRKFSRRYWLPVAAAVFAAGGLAAGIL